MVHSLRQTSEYGSAALPQYTRYEQTIGRRRTVKSKSATAVPILCFYLRDLSAQHFHCGYMNDHLLRRWLNCINTS